MICILALLIYDTLHLFEKNLRKKMYCEAMNELVELSNLVVFKNLKTKNVCQKLQKHEWMIIATSILCYCGFTCCGTILSGYKKILSVWYFNTHLLMIILDCLYIGQLFETLRRFIECLTKEIENKEEAIHKAQLIEIHSRVAKVIEKLTKAHGMHIIGSYLAIIILVSTSYYMTYALQTDFSNVSTYATYLGVVNSLLAFSFVFTWNLEKVQEMVSSLYLKFLNCKNYRFCYRMQSF